jgi:hypothetical protein
VMGLSTSTLSYPSTVAGNASASQSVTVSNSGNAPLTFTSITPGGSNAADFTVAGGTCSTSTPVAAGGSCTVAATFTPQGTVGARTATVAIASNGGNGTVTLSGTALAQPAPGATWSVTSLTVNSSVVGQPGTPSTLTLTNTGTAALTITSLQASQPSIFGVTHNCGSSLAASASCTVSVTLTPAAVTTYTDTLTLTSNASGTHNVQLTGQGTAAPQPVASVTPSSAAFADTALTQSSAATTVTLSNAGPGVLNLTTLAVTGSNGADFALVVGTCTDGKVLQVGDSCVATVTFTPQQVGARSATLSYTHDGTGASSVPLSGNAMAAPTWAINVPSTPQALVWDAGTSTYGGSVTLTNTGNMVLTVNLTTSPTGLTLSGQGGCTIANGTLTINPGVDCVISASAAAAGDWTVGINAGNAGTYNVNVTAAALPADSPAQAVTNIGAGGCSLGDPNAPLDPIWPAMTLGAAGVLVWRRVTRQQRSRVDGQMDRR